jgi:hypothetical protein
VTDAFGGYRDDRGGGVGGGYRDDRGGGGDVKIKQKYQKSGLLSFANTVKQKDFDKKSDNNC